MGRPRSSADAGSARTSARFRPSSRFRISSRSRKRSYEQFPAEGTWRPTAVRRRGCRRCSSPCSRSRTTTTTPLLEFDSFPLRRSEVHGRGVPRSRDDVRHPRSRWTLRARRFYDHDKEAKTRTIREQARPGGLPGRAAADDRQGHLHHQRHRARRGVPAAGARRGVFFDDDKGKTVASGQAALLGGASSPIAGSWVEFEFDANDILFVRVDRRRKDARDGPFLRGVHVPREGRRPHWTPRSSASFYELEEVLSFEDRTAWVKLHPEAHNGIKVADDVKAPKQREALVASGKGAQLQADREAAGGGASRGFPSRPTRWVGRRTGDRVRGRRHRRGAGRDQPGGHAGRSWRS